MAPWLLAAAYETCERLRHVWADMAYRGQRLRAWVEDECGWTLEIVERPRRWGWYPSDVEPPPVPAFRCCRAAGWWNARSLGLAGIAA